MFKRICSIALTIMLMIIPVQAQAGTLAGEPANISTESIIMNLLGIENNTTKVILQYLTPVESRKENSMLLPVQIMIGNTKGDLQVTVQYRLIF